MLWQAKKSRGTIGIIHGYPSQELFSYRKRMASLMNIQSLEVKIMEESSSKNVAAIMDVVDLKALGGNTVSNLF
jgi:hypothetical protein